MSHTDPVVISLLEKIEVLEKEKDDLENYLEKSQSNYGSLLSNYIILLDQKKELKEKIEEMESDLMDIANTAMDIQDKWLEIYDLSYKYT